MADMKEVVNIAKSYRALATSAPRIALILAALVFCAAASDSGPKVATPHHRPQGMSLQECGFGCAILHLPAPSPARPGPRVEPQRTNDRGGTSPLRVLLEGIIGVAHDIVDVMIIIVHGHELKGLWKSILGIILVLLGWVGYRRHMDPASSRLGWNKTPSYTDAVCARTAMVQPRRHRHTR